MPISTYPELKIAVTNFMARSDLAGDAGDFILLGEAALNRELDAVETDAALTGTAGSRSVDISSLAVAEPVALFLAETGRDEVMLTPKADGTFPYLDSTGRPRYWAIDGTNIDLDRPLDQAYPFRFRYRQKFALSDSAATNWLLTNHPDVYLAAVLVWGGLFVQDDPSAVRWVSILKTALPSVRNAIAQSKRGRLTVDPALQGIGRYRYAYDGIEP